jgi:hypothetical protein
MNCPAPSIPSMRYRLIVRRFVITVLLLTVLYVVVSMPAQSFDTVIPADCPIPRSTDIASITITDLHRTYDGAADTWYPVWAADGTAYSPFMDGLGANGYGDGPMPGHRELGFASLGGDNPMNLVVKKTTVIDETTAFGTKPQPGNVGRYACTLLPYKGVLYYGSSYRIAEDFHFLRPFAGFDISTDGGTTWIKRSGPLFPEADYPDIKIGEPHFVDFGPDLKNSPDGNAYLVAFGADPALAATRPKQTTPNPHLPYENPNWNWGDSIYLLRVTPAPQTINTAGSYEYYAGRDPAGKPVWTHDFAKIAPIVEWPGHMGQVHATYVPALRKYLMCITNGAKYTGPFDTAILESGDLTGPWRIVSNWSAFGKQAYFVHFPSKFLGTEVKDGQLTAWLVYSANFTPNAPDPPDSKYAMCVRQIQIKLAP